MAGPSAAPTGPATVDAQLRLAIYRVARTPYRTLRAEFEHGHWALSHVVEGTVTTLTRGERFQADSGTVMVHPPCLPYAEYAERPGSHEWLVLDAQLPPVLDLLRLHPVAPVVPLRSPAAFSRTFAELLDAWDEAASPWRELRVFALTARLLTDLLESWRDAGAPPRPPALLTEQDRFVDLIAWMSRHLDAKLRREDLAAVAHLQPNSLDKVFRATHGVTPMQLLRDLRLQRARHLLENTDERVAAVAAACGFEDPAYFHRVFARRVGQAPGRYRASVKRAMRGYVSPW